nr:2046_t:CDS:2 [Entrophospora candida]
MNSKVKITPDHKHSILTPTNEEIKLFLLSSSLRQNNQKPQNDTQDNVLSKPPPPPNRGALFVKEYRFAQVL